jgi:5'-3' exonuclease
MMQMDGSLTVLVDSASLIYRAFFSSPDSIKDPQGRLMNAAHGFFYMLARLIADLDPDYLCCAADDDWRPQWRVDLIDTYKTIRAQPQSAQATVEDELEHQMPVIVDILEVCDIAFVGHPGYEAEDVIGTLAHRAPGKVLIVSGDRDLFQLVQDPKISVVFPRRGMSVTDLVDETYITKKYGIPGRNYLDFAVLRGDPSDGLPGVRGIGEKTAAGLVSRLGDLNSIMTAAQGPQTNPALAKVKGSLDYIERARQVTKIPTDLPIEEHDLTRPRTVDARVKEVGRALGLRGPVEALVDAIHGNYSPGEIAGGAAPLE